MAGIGPVYRPVPPESRLPGDYGHHPVEIASVLKAARQSASGDVVAIVQPHRYSRLNDLFEDFSSCFNDADSVIVAPVFAAGDKPIKGRENIDLVRNIRALGHRDANIIEDEKQIASLIGERCKSGDYVVFLGAGNITQWANDLPKNLEDYLG